MNTIYEKVLDGKDVDADILLLPSRRAHSQRQVVDAIVTECHADLPLEQGRNLYEKNRKLAKAKWAEQCAREAAEHRAKAAARRLELTPWKGQHIEPLDLNGPAAFPMPVEIPSSLEPFMPILSFIATNAAVSTENAEIDPYTKVPMKQMERGIVYADGRLDLCKQSLGPKHIVDLMAALKKNDKICHFLIGNNCVSTTGAKHIADYITANPDQISTWYLAGCHLTPPAFEYLVDAMVKSNAIDNVWLKRNPLGKASVPSIVRLIIESPKLRTLDLENVELSDAGAYELFMTLASFKKCNSGCLQNLYLNANGIGARGMEGLALYLKSPAAASLQSLFLACNPIGDVGIQNLVENDTLQACKNLKVLSLHSCGLTSDGIITLAKAIVNHPSLTCLHLLRGKATTPHHQRENHIGPDAVEALRELISQPDSRLRILSLGRTAFTQADIRYLTEPLLAESGAATSLVALNVRGRNGEGIDHSVKQKLQDNRAALAKELGYDDANDAPFVDSFAFRALKNNADIQYIDSYYRNAGRSCSMKQYWDDNDPHWELIANDAKLTI